MVFYKKLNEKVANDKKNQTEILEQICIYSDAEEDGRKSNTQGKDETKIDGKKSARDRKCTFKGISKVVQLASKISPKSRRKKENTLNNITELKVIFAIIFM